MPSSLKPRMRALLIGAIGAEPSARSHRPYWIPFAMALYLAMISTMVILRTIPVRVSMSSLNLRFAAPWRIE